jgi:hypothetical protein
VAVFGKEVALPWKDWSIVLQRKTFIDAYLRQQDGVSELCDRFAVTMRRRDTHERGRLCQKLTRTPENVGRAYTCSSQPVDANRSWKTAL